MTPHELARHLRAARVAIDSCRPDLPEVVEGIGDAYITIDPESDSPYPSANRKVSPHETKLKVRQFEPAQATASARELEKVFGDRSWAEFVVSSSRLENFDHFGVYAGRNLVGVGGLYHKDDVAYIGWAATSESHRGKGGQSALITAE